MRFEALGPLRVADENGPVRLRPISRRLLSSLLVSPERPLSADALVHQLWRDEPPSSPRNSIHVHLSGLRRQLPGVIHTSGDGYLAILNGHGFDVLEFSDLVSQASRRLSEGKLRGASDLADRAARLWRGDPFFELTDVQDALSERFRLSELLVVARTTHARALTLQGRVSDSIA